MPPPAKPTVSEHLAWAYANLSMAEKAVYDGADKYGRTHFMIRSRIYREMTAGRMSPRSMMRDQRIRMKLPQQCIYCGAEEDLAVDHVVPRHRGGGDGGDNAVWACRSCNSSKSGRDLFEWWTSTRGGVPPLFVVRIYMKQAIVYVDEVGIGDSPLHEAGEHPYRFALIPTEYPPPSGLIFTPHHELRRRQASPRRGSEQRNG